MTQRILPFLVGLMLLTTSCGSKGNGSTLFPPEVMSGAHRALDEKIKILGLSQSPLSSYDSIKLTADELSALEFIYAYMPTPDMVDHTSDFHLNNVRTTLQARKELPWGKDIPAELFRHFVLPLRVNNEVLDDFRTEYYAELRELVQGMSMHDAVLELNHWSHQHITYEPSDGRTSPPIATLRNALGRCGEQSTFVVAVMRAVGIPARQVYTPRWAHTDDNHAWVEVWVDGEWHYIGASEPAPVLDNAWFDAPVLRAMMLQTNAFGHYTGAEEKLLESPTYTVLNITSNYVPTAIATARVLNPDGTPAVGATVTFRLYNYAELYPLVTRTTDNKGEATIELGLGDVMVVASRSNHELAIGQLSNKQGGTTIELTLGSYEDIPADMHFALTPPREQVPEQKFTAEQEQENNKRMAENNRIRSTYTATFPDTTTATTLADELTLTPTNRTALIELYPKSRGYHREIADFLRSANAAGKANQAVLLLSSLTEKDLHDISIQALFDVLDRDLTPNEWLKPDLISPRVMLETIYPDQNALDDAVTNISANVERFSELSVSERAMILASTVGAFKVDTLYNPFLIPVSPAKTWEMKVGDRRSLTILLVRLLRTAHIESRYDTGNGVVVFVDENDKEQILPFLSGDAEEGATVEANCPLLLTYTQERYLKTPKYEAQFSVNYILPNGQIGTYGFKWATPYHDLNGEQLLYTQNLVGTGARQANGTVLYHLSKLQCGVSTPLVFDYNEDAVSVIGSIDAESLYADIATGTEKSILSTTGRGYYLLILGKPHHEPTDHILRDLGALMDGSGHTPLPILALTTKDTSPTGELMTLLPQATWGQDTQGIEQRIAEGLEHSGKFDLPVIIIADTFNRIVYFSQGYTIGIGDRLKSIVTEIKR